MAKPVRLFDIASTQPEALRTTAFIPNFSLTFRLADAPRQSPLQVGHVSGMACGMRGIPHLQRVGRASPAGRGSVRALRATD